MESDKVLCLGRLTTRKLSTCLGRALENSRKTLACLGSIVFTAHGGKRRMSEPQDVAKGTRVPYRIVGVRILAMRRRSWREDE